MLIARLYIYGSSLVSFVSNMSERSLAGNVSDQVNCFGLGNYLFDAIFVLKTKLVFVVFNLRLLPLFPRKSAVVLVLLGCISQFPHSFVPVVLANLFILLDSGLFSPQAGVSRFWQSSLHKERFCFDTLMYVL